MKKLVSLLSVFAVMLSIVPFGAFGYEGEPAIVALKSDDAALYVGGTLYFDILIDISGLNVSDTLVNPVLTLFYDTSDIIYSPYTVTINASDFSSTFQKSPKAINAAAQTVTWVLEDLPGGTELEIPCNISLPAYYTPLGYPLNLTATLVSDNHDPISGTMTVKWIYDEKTPAMVIEPANHQGTLPSIAGTANYSVFAGTDSDSDGHIDADKTVPVIYTFNYDALGGLDTRRLMDHIEIMDRLPEGASFDPAENPEWSWAGDPSGRTVKYSGAEKNVNLILRFPEGEIGKDYLNTAEYTYYVKDPQFDDPLPEEYTRAVSAYVRLAGEEPQGHIANKTPIKTRRGSGLSAQSGHASRLAVDDEILGGYWFYSSLQNGMQYGNLRNAMISDDELDKNLEFFAFNLSAAGGVLLGTAKVQYRIAGEASWIDFKTFTPDDFKHDARQDSQLSDKADFCHASQHAGCKYTDFCFLPTGIAIDGLRVLISEMAPRGTVYLDAGAKLGDPYGVLDAIDRSVRTTFQNTTNFYYGWTDESSKSTIGPVSAYQDLIAYAPKFRGMKTATGLAVKYSGDVFTVSNRLRHMDFDNEDKIVFDGGQIIDLLPQGMAYVPGSVAFTNLNGQTLNGHFMDTEPVIVYDYKGTGQTALIWNLQGEREMSFFKSEYIIYYSYRVEILETCKKGDNILTGYFHWPEFAKISATVNNQSASGLYKGYAPFADAMDMNGNGRTDEMFLRCEIAVEYKPPTAVAAMKGIKGSYNSTYIYAPGEGYAQAGSEAGYCLHIANYSSSALNSLTLFDVLPYAGDVSLVAGHGGYGPRGSEFEVGLTGPVALDDAQDRFEIFYAKEDPAPWSGIADYDSGAAWLTAAGVGTSWNEVRAFKIVMKSGESLAVDESLDAFVPVTMPEDQELGTKAYNSYAITTGATYIEALKAGVEIVGFDAAIEKTSDKSLYNVDDYVIYTLTASNKEKMEAAAYIIDTIPAELQFVSCDKPHSYDPATGELRVELGALGAKQNIPVKVICKVKEAADPICNTAAVHFIDETDRHPDDNVASHEIVAIEPNPDRDVALTKTSDKTTYGNGQTILYTLSVENRSPRGVTNAVIEDALPAQVAFESCDAAVWSIAGNVLTISLGDMAAWAKTDITVACIAVEPGAGIKNSASATIEENESDYANNTGGCEINIMAGGGMTVEKILGANHADWGIGDDTVFLAKVRDAASGQYLTFGGVGPNYAYSGKSPAGSYISFSAGRAAEISGLPDGVICVVEEEPGPHYFASYAGNSFEVAGGGRRTVTVRNDYEHGTGNVVINKRLEDFFADWGVDETTVFYARVKDVTNGNYVHFDPIGNGFFRAGGNSGSLEPTSNTRELVSFTAGNPAMLTNLWVNCAYEIEEAVPANSHFASSPAAFYLEATGMEANDGYIGSNKVATLTNSYEMGFGNIVIKKVLAGSNNDWGVDANTIFRARVRNLTLGDFVCFDLLPDGSFRADGSSGSALPSGDPRELVSFTSGREAILRNLRTGYEYEIVEMIPELSHYSVECFPSTVTWDAASPNAVVTVVNTYQHGTGNLIVNKRLTGAYADWGVDETIVFYAKIKDHGADNYLIFKAEPEKDGSYYCVGNDALRSFWHEGEPYEGDTISLIPLQAGRSSILSNLWLGSYLVEEISGDSFVAAYSNYDSGSGELIPVSIRENSANAEIVVTNEYGSFDNSRSSSGSLTLRGAKHADGAPLTDGLFGFTVGDGNGKAVSVGTNDRYGDIIFSEIEYFEPGIYNYAISEDSPLPAGWTSETGPIAMQVVVTEYGNGILDVLPSYPSGGIVFQNTYSEKEKEEEPEKPEADPDKKATDGDRFIAANTYAPPPASPDIFIDDHIWYIRGYEDNTMRPDRAITRAEVAMVFYRLLKPEHHIAEIARSNFPDVGIDEWFAVGINVLAELGIVKGYENGEYRPNSAMTRREIAMVVSRFEHLPETDENPFLDVSPDDWAYAQILSAAKRGWFVGDDNGNFRPADEIRRSEFVTVVNRVFNRHILLEDIPGDVHVFDDFSSAHWSYAAFIEAVYTHDFKRKEDGENEDWIEITDDGIYAPYNQ